MTEDCMGLWHHYYFDNLFTSRKLMKLCPERKLYAFGTTCAGRNGWIKKLSNPKQLKLKYENVNMAVWCNCSSPLHQLIFKN
jgi:hypothetical protein